MRRLCNDKWSFGKFRPGTDMECVYRVLHGQAGGEDAANVMQAFEPVDIPHDWMIGDTGNLYQSSTGVYVRHLKLDVTKHNLVYFEGVYMNTTVYLNGQKILFWPYGYSSFEVDLTPYQKKGDNELVVFVEYKEPNTRWYSGAGIFRDVWLEEKESVRLVTDGIYFSATRREDGNWKVNVDTEIIGDRTLPSDCRADLVTELFDANQKLVAAMTEADIPVYREANVVSQTMEMKMKKVHLWDTEDPYLYTLVTTLTCKGQTLETWQQKVGFRSISFDPMQGFFLNGRHVKLNGACMHHDLGALGAAFNQYALRRQFEELKKMGVNSIRTSHNPPAVAFMELADEMGILIDSEAFDMWEMKKTTNDYGVYFHDYCERDVESWVRRDRNHPSVIMWSVGNEIPDTNNAGSDQIAIRLRNAVRRNDYRHNAYTTIGSNFIAWGEAPKASDVLEVSGYNYLESVYDEHHNSKYPHWCIYGSETASTVQSRGIYHFPKSNRLLTYEDMQCSCLDNCSTNWGGKNVHKVITDHRDRDYVAGQYIWTGWDYIGEPTPYFSKNSFFGHIDTAGFWKDTAYIFKAAWTDYHKDPFVHVSPYWDFNPGQLIDINVFSNAPKVALFFNGELVGEKDLDQNQDAYFSGEWQLPYREGVLKAVAYDELGRVIAEDVTGSFSDPVAIRLKGEKGRIPADGESIEFLQIAVVDANGVEVANARNRMQVQVTGPGRLLGMDNGDSTDYDQYKTSSRKLFSGKLLAMIGSTGKAGKVKVKVMSEGMKPAVYEFETYESDCRPHSACNYHVPGSRRADVLEPDMAKALADRAKEVPIRKMTLVCEGERRLNPDNRVVKVHASVAPANATFTDITWKAATLEGIASNAVQIEADGCDAVLTAVGDGSFRLICSAANGKDHTEVMSELEFEAEGLGNPLLNPYDTVHACQYSACNYDALLSFRGGVNLTENHTVMTFDHIDFGEYGSDELGFFIYSWRQKEPVEIWSGVPDESDLLFKGEYDMQPEYNVYQENIFHLSRRLKGEGSVTFRFSSGFVFGGFRMIYQEKAYGLLNARDNNMITGDAFDLREDGVYGIGNNTALEFLHMNFTKGVRGIEITGRSRIPSNPVHVRFKGENGEKKLICDFDQSDEIVTRTFDLEDVRGENTLNIIFLPGSDFDLISFRILPKDI